MEAPGVITAPRPIIVEAIIPRRLFPLRAVISIGAKQTGKKTTLVKENLSEYLRIKIVAATKTTQIEMVQIFK